MCKTWKILSTLLELRQKNKFSSQKKMEIRRFRSDVRRVQKHQHSSFLMGHNLVQQEVSAVITSHRILNSRNSTGAGVGNNSSLQCGRKANCNLNMSFLTRANVCGWSKITQSHVHTSKGINSTNAAFTLQRCDTCISCVPLNLKPCSNSKRNLSF